MLSYGGESTTSTTLSGYRSSSNAFIRPFNSTPSNGRQSSSFLAPFNRKLPLITIRFYSVKNCLLFYITYLIVCKITGKQIIKFAYKTNNIPLTWTIIKFRVYICAMNSINVSIGLREFVGPFNVEIFF